MRPLTVADRAPQVGDEIISAMFSAFGALVVYENGKAGRRWNEIGGRSGLTVEITAADNYVSRADGGPVVVEE
jgi:hypothetical protein